MFYQTKVGTSAEVTVMNLLAQCNYLVGFKEVDQEIQSSDPVVKMQNLLSLFKDEAFFTFEKSKASQRGLASFLKFTNNFIIMPNFFPDDQEPHWFLLHSYSEEGYITTNGSEPFVGIDFIKEEEFLNLIEQCKLQHYPIFLVNVSQKIHSLDFISVPAELAEVQQNKLIIYLGD